MSEAHGDTVSLAAAVAAVGDAGVYWRQQAERMERERDAAFAAHANLLDQLRLTFGPGGNSRWTSLLYRWARGGTGPDPMWHVDQHPEALALWEALTGTRSEEQGR